MGLTVNSIPICGKFIVTDGWKAEKNGWNILHKYNDTEGESGDIPFDVAFREVAYIDSENDYTIIRVY